MAHPMLWPQNYKNDRHYLQSALFEGPFELSMRQSRFRARCACNEGFLFSMLRPCVVCHILPATGKLSAAAFKKQTSTSHSQMQEQGHFELDELYLFGTARRKPALDIWQTSDKGKSHHSACSCFATPNSSGKQSTVRSPQTLLNMWPLVMTCLGAFSSCGWIWMVQVACGHILRASKWAREEGLFLNQGPFLDPSSIGKHTAGPHKQA